MFEAAKLTGADDLISRLRDIVEIEARRLMNIQVFSSCVGRR
jgi:hypothetical protein